MDSIRDRKLQWKWNNAKANEEEDVSSSDYYDEGEDEEGDSESEYYQGAFPQLPQILK